MGAGDSVWISHAGELWLYTAHMWRQLPAVPDNVVGGINAILADSSGIVWIGGDRGLLRLEGGAARRVSEVPCSRVLAIAPAGAGDVWIGTCHGVGRVSAGGQARRIRFDHTLTSSVYSLLSRGDDLVWAGDSVGLHRLEVFREGPSWWRARTTLAHPLHLEGAKPVVMVAGPGGGIWVGTEGAGLRWIRRMRVSRITRADGFPDRQVHHVVPDGKGGLWLGGGCGGLANWRWGDVRVFRPPALGLHTPCVRGLLRDRAGNLWIGEVGRLSRVDTAGHARPMGGAHEMEYGDVAPLLEGSDARLWFGTGTGLLGYILPDGREKTLPSATCSRCARSGRWSRIRWAASGWDRRGR